MHVRISNLEQITGILDESIMIYINAVSQIVHENAVKYGGIPCEADNKGCLLYTSPSPRDLSTSRMPSSA